MIFDDKYDFSPEDHLCNSSSTKSGKLIWKFKRIFPFLILKGVDYMLTTSVISTRLSWSSDSGLIILYLALLPCYMNLSCVCLDISFPCSNSQQLPKVIFLQILASFCNDETKVKTKLKVNALVSSAFRNIFFFIIHKYLVGAARNVLDFSFFLQL